MLKLVKTRIFLTHVAYTKLDNKLSHYDLYTHADHSLLKFPKHGSLTPHFNKCCVITLHSRTTPYYNFMQVHCLHVFLCIIQVEVYVNSSRPSLYLSYGAVSQSLLEAGGPALQDECTRYNHANGDVAEWDIATTGGAGLKCKHVIHTVGDQYDGTASEKVLFT